MTFPRVKKSVSKLFADEWRQVIHRLPTSYTEMLTEIFACANFLRETAKKRPEVDLVDLQKREITTAARLAWEQGAVGGTELQLTFGLTGERSVEARRLLRLQRLAARKAFICGRMRRDEVRAMN